MAGLRLAIATPRFWPLIDDRSTHILRLATSLAESGHRAVVVTPRWTREWSEQMAIGPLSVIRLPGSLRSGIGIFRWLYSLSRWLKEQKLDALLVDGLRQEAYVAISTAQRPAAIILLAQEGDLDWHQSATFGGHIADRCREAQAIVAPSNELAAGLLAAGYLPERLHVVPRGVPPGPLRSGQAQAEARAVLAAVNYDLATTEKATVALAVGRLDASNRFGDLVRAWRIVAARRSDARLWIVGDGPERERLYRQISDLDQRFRVFIPGTFDCLEELLLAADILLVPAAHAAPPLALLKAQAAGLPVIAADGPTARESVAHQRTGLLYPAGDVKALAAAVLRLIETPAEAVALGSAARQEAQRRPTPQMEAEAYAALIEKLRTCRLLVQA